MSNIEPLHLDGEPGDRFIRFHDLMKFRINEVLLVSSLYDSFILGEDGQLYELLLSEYIDLNLSHTPEITRVSSGIEALRLAAEPGRFDLIIATHHLEDMHVLEFAKRLRQSDKKIPLVFLSYDTRALNDLRSCKEVSCFDKLFMWQGDFNIMLAIIKCIEDILNVERDTKIVGVQSIILVEDSVKFYSSYLPIIYTELIRHSQQVIAEGVNTAHRLMRMRARPKIILCHNYEEAWKFFKKYHETILGVISDMRFPRKGKHDRRAGFKFARAIKKAHPDVPILLQSNEPLAEAEAHQVGASFILKNSPVLLKELRKFLKIYFSFGDFIFCMPDGKEVARARDLKELRRNIRTIPEESLLYHAERNHFSNWLKARTEFFLAHKLRPRKVSDYPTPEILREALIEYLREYRATQLKRAIVDFDSESFDVIDGFARIGKGSLGGKGRGLAFGRSLINGSGVGRRFDKIDLYIPATVILSSDIFDQFMEMNDLIDFAIQCDDDDELESRFLKGQLPHGIVRKLQEFLNIATFPLAVRSSSLLEDSQYQPFAGVYATYMLSNNHPDIETRLNELQRAIKRVFASTYTCHSKAYIGATPYRLEEEKMAVIIQRLVGQKHSGRFYPDFAGVARSHNFYPIPPMESGDGIASVALGMGQLVVEGGATVRFCPIYPRHLVQFSTVDDALNHSQKNFYALDLERSETISEREELLDLTRFGLDVAEQDDVLWVAGSTYSLENNVIYDGISRDGLRVVTFAPILKNDLFPLPEIIDAILKLGREGMSSPVEIEFAANMTGGPEAPREFCLLQMRPMVLQQEKEELVIGDVDPDKILCRSSMVLGNGVVDNIRDIILVDRAKFDRAKSVEVAQEIKLFNLEMRAKGRPYLLIGVGRWGSADPWLGIPVSWDDISGAAIIIESGFRDMKVTPSQGTHFFQNLTSFGIGYFTISSTAGNGFVDWEWLAKKRSQKKRKYARRIRLNQPLVIKMNGHTGEGIMLKPGK